MRDTFITATLDQTELSILLTLLWRDRAATSRMVPKGFCSGGCPKSLHYFFFQKKWNQCDVCDSISHRAYCVERGDKKCARLDPRFWAWEKQVGRVSIRRNSGA